MIVDCVYTSEDGALLMPNLQVMRAEPHYLYIPLRDAPVLAVLNPDNRCIGWILAETAGYPPAAPWATS